MREAPLASQAPLALQGPDQGREGKREEDGGTPLPRRQVRLENTILAVGSFVLGCIFVLFLTPTPNISPRVNR